MNTSKKVVLKFGGSVLHSPSDFDGIRREILRFANDGYQVVAVVSAYYGFTEALISDANENCLDSKSVVFAELIASGEFRSAIELESYLVQHGSNASRRTPKELGFTAMGDRTAAKPLSIDTSKILSALNQTQIIIVPGFSAVDENGDCMLLGRGGSDISAVCIAEALNLEGVRLLKDVDGLYDADPNKVKNAQRLEYVDYATASKIGGELIQREAIDFAASKNICIDIAAIDQLYSSRIGPQKKAACAAATSQVNHLDGAFYLDNHS